MNLERVEEMTAAAHSVAVDWERAHGIEDEMLWEFVAHCASPPDESNPARSLAEIHLMALRIMAHQKAVEDDPRWCA